jgi:hypothetical protein
LTLGDMPSNPFRYRTDAVQGAEYLQHAVLALSCHHIDLSSLRSDQIDRHSKTVLDHGRTALRLFRQSLNSETVSRMSGSLLDTILILFSLDVGVQ